VKIVRTRIPEVLLIEPDVFEDHRGHFLETFSTRRYLNQGIASSYVQDNLSFSVKDVLRGLHYQLGKPQGKLIMVLKGEIFDVAVDIRRGSPTFGQSVSVTLSAHSYRQIYIPEGFAHGFYVKSETATVLYKCSDHYAKEEERCILWNDPSLAIEWPTANPVLSDKDRAGAFLTELPADYLPVYGTDR
jgi:dTDP-4-dehydrorhamnose 3,5-epimerase